MKDRDRSGCVLTVIIILAIVLVLGGGLGGIYFLRERARQQAFAARRAMLRRERDATEQQFKIQNQGLLLGLVEAVRDQLKALPRPILEARRTAADSLASADLLSEPLWSVEQTEHDGTRALLLLGSEGRSLTLGGHTNASVSDGSLLCAGQPLQAGDATSRALYGLLARWFEHPPGPDFRGDPMAVSQLLKFFKRLEQREFEAGDAAGETD